MTFFDPSDHPHDAKFIVTRHGPPWMGRRGGRRLRRGDIRFALLSALVDEPAHGYEIIRRLEERSGGVWRPSAGSVYPTLQLLEEEGLLASEEADGKRVYRLTDSGRAAHAAGRPGGMPWERGGPEEARHRELHDGLHQLHLAVRQVEIAGEDPQLERTVGILREARQRIYQLLAEA